MRRSLALAGAVLAATSSTTLRAQIASLDKGHNLLLNYGLQIWGCDTGGNPYGYTGLTAANMNGVMWSYGQSNPGSLTTGQKWGKWVDYTGSPSTALNATEQAHYSDLLAIQVGDEQQTDLENPNGATKAWFTAAHNGNYFNDKLLYVNSTYWNDVSAYFNFIGSANPDAICWDAYPFGTTGVYPYNWLGKAQFFRRSALGSYIGASGNAARPYGLYLQTYHGSDGARDPGDLEMRWQQFTAWTMGYTFVDCFTVGGSTSLPNGSRYDQFKESARQSKNLGPALVRLISYGYGPNIVLGKDPAGATNPVPADWPVFNAANAPPNQQYLTSVSQQNLGSKNSGNPGDVYVGFFNPLLTSYGDPAGTAYFMVTNALGAYLQDPTLLVADCRQQLTLNFNTATSGVSSLLRLSRNTGQVEVINGNYNDGGNTVWTSLGGGVYQLQLKLDGGTGDLFKYNDGTPFVGINTTLYWDNDASAGNNNTSTGAGLGGSGNWDAASSKWFNGSANAPWIVNRDAVFFGTAGSVNLSTPQTANSLAFKSNGYSINGAALSLAGGFIAVDAGMTATINSVVTGPGGLVKTGGGTLILNASNTYSSSSSTTVAGGVLRVSSDANLGNAPAVFTAGNINLDGGGTLQFGGNFDINNNRGISIGAGGGTIDTQGFSNPSGYNATAGGFRGPGDLTKLGSGTFFASAPTGGANTFWSGKLILKQGIWKIVASDGLPYNVPNTAGVQQGQVTFDGGTLQIAATMNVTNLNRGMTVAAGGGTIDTQSNGFSWAGAIYGSVASATLTKLGSGTLRLNTNSANPSTFPGTLNVADGTLQLNGGNGIGDLASINLANAPGVQLNITGANETIGSLSGGGASGGNVNLNTFKLTTGGNGASTAYGGVISGSGTATLEKIGAGTMTLSGANTYTGPTNVNAGKLLLANSLAATSSVTVQNASLEIAPNGSRVLKTGALTVTGTGKLNLQDNKLITTNTVAGITSMIQSGRNGGNWSGNGIITSQSSATSSTLTSIGVATASQVKGIASGATSFWAGQTVTGSDTLVMYTYAGDATLDGKINIDDYGHIDSSIPLGLSGWFNGDFNYDGKINVDDYGLIDFNIAVQGAPFATEIAATPGVANFSDTSAVPEPALPLLSTLLLLIPRRRRRDSGHSSDDVPTPRAVQGSSCV